MARAIDEIAYEGKAGTILVENPLLAEYVKLGHIDRLRELAQADKEGRCVVLPLDDYTWTIRGDIVRGIIKANCRAAKKEAESALRRDQGKEKEDEHETS